MTTMKNLYKITFKRLRGYRKSGTKVWHPHEMVYVAADTQKEAVKKFKNFSLLAGSSRTKEEKMILSTKYDGAILVF